MIYFDNGATTRKKPEAVIEAMLKCITDYSANPGRSGHKFSIEAGEQVELARKNIKDFFGADENYTCVFTQNCTHALNLAIQGLFHIGDHFICSENDHNSILRPITELTAKGLIESSVAKVPKGKILNADDFLSLIKPNTKAIIINHVSNVNGDECDVQSISKLCKVFNILFILDTAQSAGHKKINMTEDGIDAIAVAGHKGLLGPMGVGCLIFKKDLPIKPIIYGGTGTSSKSLLQPDEIPEKFESGTLPFPNIIALSEGVNYVRKNYNYIQKKIHELTEFALRNLSELKDVEIYTSKNNRNGIIAFNITDSDSQNIASILNETYRIATRAGFHCAPLKHYSLGTYESGLIRVSLNHYNTKEEILKLKNALTEIVKN